MLSDSMGSPETCVIGGASEPPSAAETTGRAGDNPSKRTSAGGNVTMSEPLPALCLIAVPGRRRRTIELCQETERRGFAGIYVPSPFGNMSMCETPGKPLADTRAFIEKFRAEESFGPLPPIIVAALRKRMVALSGELAQGVVFANASLSHMGQSLAALPAAKRNDAGFFIGNMIPTCISDDMEAAKAVNRRTLTNYAFLPNYRNYWKEAGYVEEMDAIETAVAEGRRDDVAKCLSDKWLADNTLFGPAARVREGVAAWRAAGVHTPILVPSSAAGNQMKAIEEVFAAFG